MVKDLAKVYRDAYRFKGRYLLLGHFNGGNFGDELLLEMARKQIANEKDGSVLLHTMDTGFVWHENLKFNVITTKEKKSLLDEMKKCGYNSVCRRRVVGQGS